MRTLQANFWAAVGDITPIYADRPVRTAYLVDLVSKYLPLPATILEPGANMGRNVAGLRAAGYSVHGFDVNPYCAAHNQIETAVAEEYLPTCKTYDAVVTMAFLEHIPEESTLVFDELARIAQKLIVTIEDEVSDGTNDGIPYHMPRDYSKVFTSRGWNEIYSYKSPADLDEEFVARVFRK